MNLLSLLLGTMNSQSSVNALSEKTGSSSKQTSLLISLAVPLLLRYLTSNASSQNGASSLLGALMQHKSKGPMAEQLKDADEEDGSKIISHILGNDSSEVISQLSGETGMSDQQVTQLLYSMAPALLSGLSAAASTASDNSGTSPDHIDFSDLYNSFGAADQSQGTQSQNAPASPFGGLGLFGSLLGGGLSGNAGSSQSSTAAPDSGSSLPGFFSLFGNKPSGSGSAQTSQQSEPMIDLFAGSQQGDYDGSSLLNSLMAIMRE